MRDESPIDEELVEYLDDQIDMVAGGDAVLGDPFIGGMRLLQHFVVEYQLTVNAPCSCDGWSAPEGLADGTWRCVTCDEVLYDPGTYEVLI